MRPRSDTLLVWTGAPCTYGCSACPIDRQQAPVGLQLADVQRGLAAIPTRRGRLAVLLGGEPLLRPDVLRLIAVLRASGCVPGIVTTGRPLVYPQLRDRLRRAGLEYLRMQFFGVGEVHDRAAAVPGAFEQAVAGLRDWVNEAGTQCDVDVMLTIRSRIPAALASEIEALAREISAPNVQLIVALDHWEHGEPGHTEPLRCAVAPLAHWNDDPTRPLLAWEGQSGEPALPASCLTIPALPAKFIGGAPRACCLGAVDTMVRAAATPPQAPRANSFNFVRSTTSVAWTATAATCSAHAAAVAGCDPSRQLWLVEGEQLVLHATDTGDFDAAEIARVKDDFSHLFIDCAPAGVLDDITQGMRRVLPDPICATCVNRTRCGRRYHVVDGPPFAREEAWIGDYVARLRGRVLDVGCGEQLYRDQIGPLIRSGDIRYTGLDPDESSLAQLRRAFPEGRFALGGIEDFHGEPASYDHVLCLRSLNHVFDVDEALARMAEVLVPGGSLLIVECTPFAMLRRPEQVAAADRLPRAGHQHFRNVASEEILPLVRRRALRVLHHDPASLQTTNEWILLVGRPHSIAA